VNAVLAVALGGAVGSVARFGLNTFAIRLLGTTFPWGILVVNVLGCLAMGIIAAVYLQKSNPQDSMSLFLMTGVLGGFTTFSAFALDALKLSQSGANGSAILYVLGSVVLSLVAVFVGFALVKAFA
jgi:fluoride exporter